MNSNFVQAGGGIAADGQASVRVTRSHFIGNFASGGGTNAEGGSGGAVWLGGSARAEISNTSLVTNSGASTLASRNAVVVRDQATLALSHVILFDFSIEAPATEPPHVSLEASVVYDTAEGVGEHARTLRAGRVVRSPSQNRSQPHLVTAQFRVIRAERPKPLQRLGRSIYVGRYETGFALARNVLYVVAAFAIPWGALDQ